ncbi:MAG: hypothetical protein K2J42_09525 [Muribaculaceae bacterium]|nr:hypothetical protein [Muribaculaceae bacterium]
MSLSQLKRALWVMNELVGAGHIGISSKKLCEKWQKSTINDRGEMGPLTERTFYRLRRDLETLFNVDILCSVGSEKRYYIDQTEYSVFLGMFSKLVTDNAQYGSNLKQLFFQVMSGMEISAEDKATIENIAFKLGKVAYETLGLLITEANNGKIEWNDRAQWGEVKYHTHFWLEETYQRTLSWIGVAIDRKGQDGYGTVRFYIGNESDDTDFHSRLIREFDLLPPKKIDGHYWWFAPRDISIHLMKYASQPNIDAIRLRIESLSQHLNSIS